jgi:MFS transporter, DHA1 family, multidrug resistance protein
LTGSAPLVPVRPPRHLVALLAGFTSLVVLTTDVYLPVLPRLGRDLHASNAAAAATVSAVLIGIAVGQIVIGPLSDAVGRRIPMLAGAFGYAVLHVLAALAPNIATLLVLRALTGLATAACIVVARAVVADVYPGTSAARAFATLSAVTAIVPVLAPAAGGLLSHVMSWRGMFLLLAAAATVVGVIGWRGLPETRPAEQRGPARFGPVLRDLGALLRRRHFLGYVAAMAAVGGILFGYIGASSFVLEDIYALSPQQFSLVFAANSVGLFVVTWVARHLVARAGPRRLLLTGQLGSISGAGVLALGVAGVGLAAVLAGLFVSVASLGLVMPMATSLGMAEAAGWGGAASGVIGICQFTVGAVASPLAGLGDTAWSLVIVMAVSALAGLGLRLVLLGSGSSAVTNVRSAS